MFILMISFAILIWIASGKNPMDASLLAQVCGISPSPYYKLSLHIDTSLFHCRKSSCILEIEDFCLLLFLLF